MSRRSDIVQGMASQLWYEAAGRHSAQRDGLSTEEAARDLVKLYEAANSDTITSIVDRFEAADLPGSARRRGDRPKRKIGDEAVGRLLASYAIHTVSYFGDDTLQIWNIAGLKTPTFSIKKVGHTIEWDGDQDDRRPVVRMKDNPSRKPRTVVEVREILASRDPESKCYETCQGWEVFDTDGAEGHEEFEIQVCDECNGNQPKHLKLRDDDVEQLPEAQLALAKTLERIDAEEREEVEGQVREIHGGKVVPRGNPGVPARVGDRVAVRGQRGVTGEVTDVRGDEVEVGGRWYPVASVSKLGMGRPPGVPNPGKHYTKPHDDSSVWVDDLTILKGDEVLVRPTNGDRPWRRTAVVDSVDVDGVTIADADGVRHSVPADWLWLYGGHGNRAGARHGTGRTRDRRARRQRR